MSQRTWYRAGALFVDERGDLPMLTQVGSAEYKLVCLRTGNRLSDIVVMKDRHQITKGALQRVSQTSRTLTPVPAMSELEVALWMTRRRGGAHG